MHHPPHACTLCVGLMLPSQAWPCIYGHIGKESEWMGTSRPKLQNLAWAQVSTCDSKHEHCSPEIFSHVRYYESSPQPVSELKYNLKCSFCTGLKVLKVPNLVTPAILCYYIYTIANTQTLAHATPGVWPMNQSLQSYARFVLESKHSSIIFLNITYFINCACRCEPSTSKHLVTTNQKYVGACKLGGATCPEKRVRTILLAFWNFFCWVL
jgi:hypothetical protein